MFFLAASPSYSGNWLIEKFHEGGPIMWPILGVAIVALAVMLERSVWWRITTSRRDLRLREKVLTAVDQGEIETATALAAPSKDPVLQMIWHGLTHHHFSLQGAMQVQAGEQLERAGRFITVLDTIITLAPLLGLLGTVVGIMEAFQAVGHSELAVAGVSGGISEALIATGCGLLIAICSLVPFNYFQRRVSRLRFELETNATNLELMIERSKGFLKGAPAPG